MVVRTDTEGVENHVNGTMLPSGKEEPGAQALLEPRTSRGSQKLTASTLDEAITTKVPLSISIHQSPWLTPRPLQRPPRAHPLG